MAIEAFRGTHPQKVDSKARVSIPAALRRILEEGDPQNESAKDLRPRVYMIFGGPGRDYVECYSKSGSDDLATRISAMKEGSKERNQVEWELIGKSALVEIEPDGRVVLPGPVRSKMGFGPDDLTSGGEAVFVGLTNKFRLYRREVFEAADAARQSSDRDPLTVLGEHMASG